MPIAPAKPARVKMEQRYVLRFESGERAGETIPIEGREFTIGRKPGHSLQILDNSVSGKHAEIVVDERGVLLRDLGSTNGTRVGNERVIETRLSHGDRVVFGNIQMVFVDTAVADPLMTTASPGATTAPIVPAEGAAPAADTLMRVSPEVLARSRKRPIAGLLGLLVLVGAAGALWYYLGRPATNAVRAARPARPAAENLLGEDYSFENEPDGWKALEDAPVAFLKSAQGRFSGAVGLFGDFSEAAWALHRSRELHTEAGRTLVGSVRVRVEAGACAHVGVWLSPPEGPESAGAVIAWSKPFDKSGDFGDAQVAAIVPPGYETASLVILGRGPKGSSVAADDAALIVRDASGPDAGTGAGTDASGAGSASVTVRDWHLALLGEPASAGVLSRFGHALVTGLAFCEGPVPVQTAQAGRLDAIAAPDRISIASPQRTALGLRAETALVRTGLATIGVDGYATHGLDFERENVTSILLGKGGDLVRVGFGSPVSVKGVAEGLASRIQVRAVAGAVLEEVVLQLDFTEERRKAGDLAYAAPPNPPDPTTRKMR
jgi:hypothetical protein